jgi:protein-L-isoaspartate O-methyltransferase
MSYPFVTIMESFEVILNEVNHVFLDQLAEGGRLVIPVGSRMGQDLIKATKRKGKLIEKSLGPVQFVGLIGTHGWRDTD